MGRNFHTIAQMFDTISRYYNFMNDLMTFFSHRRTRTIALKFVSLESNKKVLDLATGTGDFAFQSVNMKNKPILVVGVDLSPKMLSIAKSRSLNKDQSKIITFNLSDIKYLPFQDNIFNLCTVGYGVRNVDDSLRMLKEVRRVTDNSGILLIVEATSPRKHMVRFFSELYFYHVIPILAKMLRMNIEAYRYLGESISQFPSVQRFAAIMKKAGWIDIRYYTMYKGIVTIFLAKK